MKSLTKKRSPLKTSSTFPKGKDPQTLIDNSLFLSILRGLLTDVSRLRPGTKGLDRDYVTLEARVKHEGPAFLGTALCNLGKAFDEGLSKGVFTCPTGFKTQKGTKIPRLFQGIFRDVFDPPTGRLKGGDLTEDVKILRQLLFFLEEAGNRPATSFKAYCENRLQLRSDGPIGQGHCPFPEGPYQPDLPFSPADS